MLNKRILNSIDEAAWRAVPDEAVKFAAAHAAPTSRLFKAVQGLPGYGLIFYSPLLKRAEAITSGESRGEWASRLSAVEGLDVSCGELGKTAAVPPGHAPWMCFEKTALKASTLFGPLSSLAGWRKGPVADVFGGPSTMSAAVGTGLLGAGLGYGAGWIGEKIVGEDSLKKGKLRRTLAALGAGAGVAPALWAGYRGWFKQSSAINDLYEELSHRLPTNNYIELLEKRADFGFGAVNNFLNPEARVTTGFDGGGYWEPTIPKDNLNQMIWSDPMTPTTVRAGASGLVSGASAAKGGDTWISPGDIARVAAGMGAGYVSGRLVGKTLGALAGLEPGAQKRLQQAGMWSSLLTTVVPKAFGF